MSAREYVHVSAVSHEGQKVGSSAVQVIGKVISCAIWVPGPKIKSSPRACS